MNQIQVLALKIDRNNAYINIFTRCVKKTTRHRKRKTPKLIRKCRLIIRMLTKLNTKQTKDKTTSNDKGRNVIQVTDH